MHLRVIFVKPVKRKRDLHRRAIRKSDRTPRATRGSPNQVLTHVARAAAKGSGQSKRAVQSSKTKGEGLLTKSDLTSVFKLE